MIRGLEHVGLSVANLERSIRFYCENFGFTVERILECGEDVPLGDVVGMPSCTARIAHLKSEKSMLELFEYTKPRGKSIPENTRQADLGYIHIGFTTTDMKADYARLKERGVRFFNEPVEFRPGVWVVYFYGPDGEVCELRQT